MEITVVGIGKKNVYSGITGLELVGELGKGREILAMKIDNTLCDLKTTIPSGSVVELIDISTMEGMRVYRDSAVFLLSATVRKVFPEREMRVEHPLSKGEYCVITGGVSADDCRKIERMMKQMVETNLLFERRRLARREAKELFVALGIEERAQLVDYAIGMDVELYRLGDWWDLAHYPLVPSTGYLNLFKIVHYPPGFILLLPDILNPTNLPEFEEQKKLFEIYQEYERWASILGVRNVVDLNTFVRKGKLSDLIKIAEALHEKKVAQIADEILEAKKRVILIAGPSSSGKTTFAKRLSIQMRVNGLRPYALSMDNYFLDRERTPRTENGEYDFDSIKALDVELFNKHLAELLSGKRVQLPKFNFKKGKREKGELCHLEPDQPIIIEGIHALNPIVTEAVSEDEKLKIYVSALSTLNLDRQNRMHVTDNRLLRRMVRDNLFRGHSAQKTIARWPLVRKGEERFVFPFQEDAHVMFNTALVYEFAVLKRYAEGLLRQIEPKAGEYSEAQRLLHSLSFFLEISPDEVPPTSILREFIGGSSFQY